MLVRIVRMYFKPEHVDDFLKIFDANQKAIAGFPGCQSVELLRDEVNPSCYCTLSRWNDAASLEAYRKSELFGRVWKSVKPMFERKAEAVSLVGPTPAATT